jgi:hypothetical protein
MTNVIGACAYPSKESMIYYRAIMEGMKFFTDDGAQK